MHNKDLLALLDLTSLSEHETEENIVDLCKKAVTPLGAVAAVCVYPKWITLCKDLLKDSSVLVATVANFPKGDASLSDSATEIEFALNQGADEIDIVMDYQAFIKGDRKKLPELIKTCKAMMPNNTLKVILETGALNSIQIEEACILAIQSGANFLKTSTGKISQGANLSAAEIMLSTIKKEKCDTGFKASGGVKTIEQAQTYFDLAQNILNPNWPDAKHFRIGASSLVDAILN